MLGFRFRESQALILWEEILFPWAESHMTFSICFLLQKAIEVSLGEVDIIIQLSLHVLLLILKVYFLSVK